MLYQFEFRPYRRRFKSVLKTHHGSWTHREGIIIRLMDNQGQVGFGEIAPLSWFGSETQEQAIDFCKHFPKTVSAETILSIPAERSACQFGFESALSQFNQKYSSPFLRGFEEDPCSKGVDHSIPPHLCCALLPTGETALQAWQTFWQAGRRTFKLKIGVAPIQLELDWLTQLAELLPQGAKLRLDANGGLTKPEAHQWLEQCDRLDVEFLEQPLPPNQLPIMLQLSNRYQTPIALDESVATLQQLKTTYFQGWRGIFIIKPAILGFPSQLKQFYQTHAFDVVFSSVFETAIGRDAILSLAAEISNHSALFGLVKSAQAISQGKGDRTGNPDTLLPGSESGSKGAPRALGFGAQAWLETDGLDSPDFEKVWRSL